MPYLKKVLPILLSLITLSLVILKVEAPKSLASATTFPLLAFFIPLTILFFSIFNLFFKFYLKSLVATLAILLLIVLKALNALNLIGIIVSLAAIILVIKFLKKPVNKQKNLKNLYYQGKIPKLSELSKKK